MPRMGRFDSIYPKEAKLELFRLCIERDPPMQVREAVETIAAAGTSWACRFNLETARSYVTHEKRRRGVPAYTSAAVSGATLTDRLAAVLSREVRRIETRPRTKKVDPKEVRELLLAIRVLERMQGDPTKGEKIGDPTEEGESEKGNGEAVERLLARARESSPEAEPVETA
jgi:hypothetical protein